MISLNPMLFKNIALFGTFKHFVFVYLCILHLIHWNVIFDILESHAFKNIAHVGSLKHFVFVYLRICVFMFLCILHLIHGNVIFDILESHAFQKYSTCWVLSLSLSLSNLKNLKNLKKWLRAGSLLDHDNH